MSKVNLVKRLSWYYPTERFNAFMFAGVFIFVIIKYGFINTLFLSYGLLLMTVILFEGQYYWKLKLYRLTNKQFNQLKNINLFKKLKGVNTGLIALVPIVLFLQLLLQDWTLKPGNLFYWGLAANIFGILEHVNYFYRQLMIDNLADVQYILRNKKLKIASLKKDLDDNEI